MDTSIHILWSLQTDSIFTMNKKEIKYKLQFDILIKKKEWCFEKNMYHMQCSFNSFALPFFGYLSIYLSKTRYDINIKEN